MTARDPTKECSLNDCTKTRTNSIMFKYFMKYSVVVEERFSSSSPGFSQWQAFLSMFEVMTSRFKNFPLKVPSDATLVVYVLPSSNIAISSTRFESPTVSSFSGLLASLLRKKRIVHSSQFLD